MEYRDFYNDLSNGEEYITCMMNINTFNGLDFEAQQLMYQSEIRQKNDKFKDDDVHKEYVKRISKAKKDLRDYEFNINNKM
jgi:hypothetical protein